MSEETIRKLREIETALEEIEKVTFEIKVKASIQVVKNELSKIIWESE